MNITNNIEIKDVSKSYQNMQVLNNINIKIGKGIYGLLGENGAGKTTLIKIISGEIMPTNGYIIINRMKAYPEDLFNLLGYLPQNYVAPGDMNVIEYLKYVYEYKKDKESVNNIEELIEVLDLKNYTKTKIKKLSGGTVQRVGIAQAFLNNPELIILDEPTSGLDITQRRNLKNFILEKSKYSSIVISTHIVSDIDYIANYIILLKDGVVISKGEYSEQLKELDKMVWEFSCKEEELFSIKERINYFGGIVTNSRNESLDNHILRFVCGNKIFDKAINRPVELNDLYLWKVGKFNA